MESTANGTSQDKGTLICYTEDTIHKMIDILNQIEVKGVTNVTGLSAIINLLNSVEATIPKDGE